MQFTEQSKKQHPGCPQDDQIHGWDNTAGAGCHQTLKICHSWGKHNFNQPHLGCTCTLIISQSRAAHIQTQDSLTCAINLGLTNHSLLQMKYNKCSSLTFGSTLQTLTNLTPLHLVYILPLSCLTNYSHNILYLRMFFVPHGYWIQKILTG